MSGPLRCSRAGWCRRLDECLADEANAHVKGLVQFTVTNFATSVKTTYGVMYRASAKDRGMMLNFCPWCGESIQFWPEQNAREHMEPERGEIHSPAQGKQP